MPSKWVTEELAKSMGALLIESGFPKEDGISNDDIIKTGLVKGEGLIQIVRDLVREKKIKKDEKGEIVFEEDERIRKPKEKPSYQAGDPKTPATDKIESDTIKRLVEEETRHTKDVAIEILNKAMQNGRYVLDNFQSKARWKGMTTQRYLYEASRFYEQYNGVIELAEQEGSIMEEAMRNASWRIDSLEREIERERDRNNWEHDQKDLLIASLRLQLEKVN